MARWWGIDLGTSNTGVAFWDEQAGSPRLLALPELCSDSDSDDPHRPTRMIPSVTEVLEARGVIARLGRNPTLSRHVFLGRWGWIGHPALVRNELGARPGFVRSFKPWLGRAPLHGLARLGAKRISAREVASVFVRELLASVRRVTGERVSDAVVTAPVDAYEIYRMELSTIFRAHGCRRVRFLDEPVAAALGYGVGLERRATVLVVDFGGGTLHLALVRLDPRRAQHGTAEVLAKAGVALGGDNVDEWLVDDLCRRFEYEIDAPGDRVWRELLLSEARRVKEALFFEQLVTFFPMLPEELRRFEARLDGKARGYDLTRGALVELLDANGLYRAIAGCLADLERQSRNAAYALDQVDEVLMIGGSTLLPRVYATFERRFGRERVRAWQPFEAVAHGAATYAAGAIASSDFIVHDYAFVTFDARTHEPRYTKIVPAGTRFPTEPDFWKRQLVPTCPLGVPETMFKLVICEIGVAATSQRRLGWDEQGALHDLGAAKGGSEQAYVVKLNERNPTLGFLDPPQRPNDRAPRLEIAFGVNAERWLVASVRDLKTGKQLLVEEPVVKVV